MVDRELDCLYSFLQIRSHYQEGAELFERLITGLRQTDLSTQPQSNALLARTLGRCGAFYQPLSDYEAAERYLQEGLCLAQAIDDQQEIAFCLNILGQVAVWRGQKERGRAHLNESLTLCRAIEDKSGVVFALQQLANLLYATFGNYDESKALAEECLSISRELGQFNQIAYALDTLGFVTFARGEYRASRAYYQEAYSLFKEIGDQHGQALTLGGLGMVNWAAGGERLFNAMDDFERSLALCRKIGHQGQVSGRLGGLARILNDLGEYERALDYSAEGLVIARKLGSPVYISHNLYCLVETACGMNDLSAGRRYLQEGLSVAQGRSAVKRGDLSLLLWADPGQREQTCQH
jgi:tetratricopeptide (TPR) repeat protein